jgi:hypothetical protein
MTDADYSFEVPEFEDFSGAANDQADKWFGALLKVLLMRDPRSEHTMSHCSVPHTTPDERRCTSMKKRKVHSSGAQSKTKGKTAIARVKAAVKGVRKAKK